MKQPQIFKCKQCEYEWMARVRSPVECPDCKSRNWKGDRDSKYCRRFLDTRTLKDLADPDGKCPD